MNVETSRLIARPAGTVFEFFSDAQNNPLWQKGMESCIWTSEPPIGVGSTYEQVARFMGKSIVSTFVVTNFVPGRSITIETVESTFPIRVERTVEMVDDASCRVTAHISGGPGGLLAKLAPMTDWMANRSIEADYDRLVTRFSSLE
ncbi:MAG: SRPBCC family protein [Acidimicrobiia bacterium]|nr:SRPBCC family protein [Acidimicrobiia bacterium]